MIHDYPHKIRIHCETGSIKNMLDYYAFPISEEMVFGIGSGYDFIHFPFPMFNKCETPLFRSTPGRVFLKFTKRMHIQRCIKKFIFQGKAMRALDALLDKDLPVGLVVEIIHLPFFPLKDRSFPAHTLVVIGKEENEYIVSDCDYHFPDESLKTITYQDLLKARFPKSMFSPKGKLFYIKTLPKENHLKQGIIESIKDTCHQMLDIPFPYFGVKGIYFLSKRIRSYDKTYGRLRALDNIKWQIQTSEEAGTGGSGYRYMYATFLKQAGKYLQDEQLTLFADDMRDIADKWQLFALEARHFLKGHNGKNMDGLADIVFKIAQMEEKFFINLKKWSIKMKSK